MYKLKIFNKYGIVLLLQKSIKINTIDFSKIKNQHKTLNQYFKILL